MFGENIDFNIKYHVFIVYGYFQQFTVKQYISRMIGSTSADLRYYYTEKFFIHTRDEEVSHYINKTMRQEYNLYIYNYICVCVNMCIYVPCVLSLRRTLIMLMLVATCLKGTVSQSIPYFVKGAVSWSRRISDLLFKGEVSCSICNLCVYICVYVYIYLIYKWEILYVCMYVPLRLGNGWRWTIGINITIAQHHPGKVLGQ